MLRELRVQISRRLSSYTKARIRTRLYASGLLTPKPVERLVLDAIRIDGADYFLQIGAHDGQYADPLNLAVNTTKLRGVLVEPHPMYFNKLKGTYRAIDGLTFVNAGVSQGDGHLTLHTFDADDPAIPAWLHGSSSFSRAEVASRAERVPGAEAHIREITVPLVSVDTLLKTCARPPGIVVLDAEGFDAMILRQFDFANLSPTLVIYESEAMTPEDAEAIETMFTAASYRILRLGQDTVAIHSRSKLSV
jgi:FkbM family methyltransferase